MTINGKPLKIAIDGTVASGKGTVAKLLARRLNFLCLDTGALYRGMTIHFMNKDIKLTNPDDVALAIKSANLDVECVDNETRVFLNNEDITSRLRSLEVCNMVYKVATIPAVRDAVRELQHRIACCEPIVCEGRDIGSVVFPDAQIKFYLTATLKARAERRLKMEHAKGNTDTTYKQVRDMIRARDHGDKTRAISPLIKAPGSVTVDASHLTPDQVVDKMVAMINKKLKCTEMENCCP